MRKYILAAIGAAAAIVVMMPMAASAATIDVLTTAKVGGTNVAVGATLKAGLKSGTKVTFYSPGTTTGIVCTKSSFTEKVTKNPAKPGTADTSVTALTFSGCTSNVSGVDSVKSITANKLPYKGTTSDAKGLPVTVAALSATVDLNTEIGAVSCTYTAKKITGAASNTGSTVAFKNQTLTFSTGSSVCPASGDYSSTFGPVKDTSVSGSPHVFVN
jgi:hypothetical protein